MSSFTRSNVSFFSHETRCAAWLYRPDSVVQAPIVVMAHGFAATRALRLDAYANRFAQAGYGVLAFDYRGWGDSEGEPRRVLSIRAQHADWRAALAYARSFDWVNPSRTVAWGTSFAGGHVLTLAARGERFAAVIAQVPHVSGPAAARANSPKLIAQLSLAATRDQLGAMIGRQPYRVPAAGAPGSVAMMTSPDALPLAERLAGDRWEELREQNDVAARIALRIPFYSPGRTTHLITAPTLVQVAERDEVTPHDVAMHAARRIPNVTILTYDCQHFEPYLDPFFESVVSDQLSFLSQHV